MENLYSVELRHQQDPGEPLDSEDEEGMMGKKSSRAHDWLSVQAGEENLFVNVRRQLGNRGRGEVYAQLSHSFHLLKLTGNHCVNITLYFIHFYSSLSLSLFVFWIQVYLPTSVPR